MPLIHDNSLHGTDDNALALSTLDSNGQDTSIDQCPTSKTKTQAVLIVFSSFMLTFTACGLNFAFGVYQELYESMSKSPGPFEGATPAQIDLIGTLAVSLMTMGAPFASAWTKSYSPRTITLIGGFIFGLANVLASFGQKLWHFVLAQGLLIGCATCLTYIPAVTIPPGWFTTHRGLALGMISSGTGVGGVAWAPALRALNAHIGFRDTLRLTGALSFVMIGLSGLSLKWDPDSERRNRLEMQASRSRINVPLVDWHIARSRKFIAQCLSASLQSAAYYAPVYFFSSYARTLGYSAATGATFISISNASSAIGKIIIGYIADRFGRINVLFFCTFVSSITVLGVWLPSTLAGSTGDGKNLFLAYAILYGVFAGTYISLFPAALVELFGVQHFASVNGFLYMMRGFACLVGTPVAGALIRGSHGEGGFHLSKAYLKSAILIGVLMVGATVGVAWVRIEAAIGKGTRREGERRGWKV
jgi:MFS family permease